MKRRRFIVGFSMAGLLIVGGTSLWALNRRAATETCAAVDGTSSGNLMDWWDWSKAEAMITVTGQKDLPQLHRAAGEGDLVEVKRLLAQGADTNSRDADGWTPLQWAAYEGQAEVVRFLLSAGADRDAHALEPGELNWLLNTDFIRPVSAEQWTSLHKRKNETALRAALAKGRAEAADLLLDPSLDQKGKDELLLWAVKWKYAGGAAIMLAHGANANDKDEFDWTPLHWAARGRDPKTVEVLLNAGADPNATAGRREFPVHPHGRITTPAGETPLHLGAAHGDVVSLLLAHGADLNVRDADGNTALHKVGDRGDAAEVLLSHGADANARNKKGETPLALSMGYYITGARDALIARGADVNARDAEGKSLLHRALGAVDLSTWLLDHGADPNARDNEGRTPLHDLAAANWGPKRVEYAKLMLSRGADVNAKDSGGATPLDLAVKAGNREVAVFLQGQARAAKGGGWPPLHQAAATGNAKLAEDLLRKGANVNGTAGFGLTPLHVAVAAGQTEMVKLLLRRGADVNAADQSGWAPLHKAAWEGNTEIARILIAVGAKLDARTADGEMPLHLAVPRAQFDVVELLLSKGADPNARGKGEATPMCLTTCISVPDDQSRMMDILGEHGAEF